MKTWIRIFLHRASSDKPVKLRMTNTNFIKTKIFERCQRISNIKCSFDKMHPTSFIGFESLGCWRDAWSRSLPTLEGEHYLLMDPNYKGRRHALFKCARAALDKGYNLFGIENGGQCFASADEDKGYHKYGASKECKGKKA